MSESRACQNRNPLVRDGTSQLARALPALDPARAPVDGRNLAAYLEYLRGYSKKLPYWALSNTPMGDWEPFIARDVSSVAAAVATQDAERERRRLLELARSVTRPDGGWEPFGRLLNALFALVLRLDGWAVPGAEGLSFGEILRREIHGGLRADLLRLIGIYRGAQEVERGGPAPGLDAESEVNARRVIRGGLNPSWWAGEKDWASFLDKAPADKAAFGDEELPELERLARALEYLRPLLKSLPRTLARMAEAAARDLDKTLADWPRHEPPMALVLTFLHLLRHALNDLDGLTARHLEYHFQEVLRLRPREAEPDRVFVTFELARHLQSHVVPAGTVVVGGKDEEGLTLRYRLEEDLRLDQATVGPFMAVHKTGGGILTASPFADSVDGLGAPIPEALPGWPAFGSDAHPAATVGFAFTTRVLLLEEGERIITVTLELPGATELLGRLHQLKPFRVELTGAKGWIAPRAEARPAENRLQVVLTLAPEEPPVTCYQRKVHGGNLDTAWPVCRFILEQDQARGCSYQALSSLTFTGATVDVQVKGFRKLQLETDAGRQDPSKPFALFGAQPLPGSSFSVRCAELQPKALTSLALDLQWLEPSPGLDLRDVYSSYALEPITRSDQGVVTVPPPVSRDSFQVEVSAGLGPDPGSAPGSTHGGGLFEPGTFAIRPAALSAGGQPRSIDTVRVRLTRPLHGFGHNVYPRLQAEAVLAITQGKQERALPSSPVTPRLAAISLAYSARDAFGSGAASQPEAAFFHLHPFGETAEKVVDRGTPLLPPYLNEGELYIGLASTKAQQRTSLLFHVVDGSGDPLLETERVSWGYLDHNQRFQPFPKEAVGDGTGGLLRSGLLRVVLPANATDAGGRLPAGRFWIRASIPSKSAAACRIIAVHARATSAQLLDAARHPAHLRRALPAGTVCALEQRQAAIKKVEQPIASFGGRAPEDPLAFARRASERLRHKQRAITLQDYEKLTLEAFPSLYKVKCLNHYKAEHAGGTELEAGADGELSDVEIAPGWVTVVAVPNLVGRGGHNPFAPCASQATLAAVEELLAPLVGAFVQLKAVNPVYEPVRLGFTVRFRPVVDDPAVGIARLKQEINAFLSPWAFEDGKDIIFGGALHRSTLLHFVEKRPYVDYVTDFRVIHLGGEIPSEEERIVTRTSRSILVSDGDHDIIPEGRT